ncbi:MAG: DUF445 family protein [Clostridia bacterium]|nr:DUF445 family protein [Clostridia bacterium]MDD4146229.1 DUF445 family protein [Clostridia bacterium]MDD4665206.1 DUF445 family protein [Clostridia bacterium]
MHNFLFVVLMGFIGAGIGWITNVLAIRLLFKPYQEYKVPVLGWRIQGLIPKRQKDIAVALGEIVSTELITGNDVLESLSRKDIQERLQEKFEKYVREQVFLRMPFVIPESILVSLAEFVAKRLGQEVNKFLNNPGEFFREQELNEIKREIKRIVEEKVVSLEMASLEEIVYALARSELKHIEIIGGVLGFFIGLAQGIISIFWQGLR